jgi:hypothetical protein
VFKYGKWAIGGSAIILMGIGVTLSATLFYIMFKYADQGNLVMVVFTSILIVVVSTGTMKGLTYILGIFAQRRRKIK